MTTTVWLDVRTPEEFAQGHLPGALLVPYDQIDASIKNLIPDLGCDLQVYCRSGNRSGIAKRTLEKLGYTQVTNAGGYELLRGR